MANTPTARELKKAQERQNKVNASNQSFKQFERNIPGSYGPLPDSERNEFKQRILSPLFKAYKKIYGDIDEKSMSSEQKKIAIGLQLVSNEKTRRFAMPIVLYLTKRLLGRQPESKIKKYAEKDKVSADFENVITAYAKLINKYADEYKVVDSLDPNFKFVSMADEMVTSSLSRRDKLYMMGGFFDSAGLPQSYANTMYERVRDLDDTGWFIRAIKETADVFRKMKANYVDDDLLEGESGYYNIMTEQGQKMLDFAYKSLKNVNNVDVDNLGTNFIKTVASNVYVDYMNGGVQGKAKRNLDRMNNDLIDSISKAYYVNRDVINETLSEYTKEAQKIKSIQSEANIKILRKFINEKKNEALKYGLDIRKYIPKDEDLALNTSLYKQKIENLNKKFQIDSTISYINQYDNVPQETIAFITHGIETNSITDSDIKKIKDLVSEQKISARDLKQNITEIITDRKAQEKIDSYGFNKRMYLKTGDEKYLSDLPNNEKERAKKDRKIIEKSQEFINNYRTITDNKTGKSYIVDRSGRKVTANKLKHLLRYLDYSVNINGKLVKISELDPILNQNRQQIEDMKFSYSALSGNDYSYTNIDRQLRNMKKQNYIEQWAIHRADSIHKRLAMKMQSAAEAKMRFDDELRAIEKNMGEEYSDKLHETYSAMYKDDYDGQLINGIKNVGTVSGKITNADIPYSKQQSNQQQIQPVNKFSPPSGPYNNPDAALLSNKLKRRYSVGNKPINIDKYSKSLKQDIKKQYNP